MFERAVAILKEHIDNDEIEITRDSALVDDLALSSLEVINIVADFEHKPSSNYVDRLPR